MKNNMSAKRLALIGMLGALGAILMMFRFPIPFMPPFLSFDLAAIPELIGAFALGPVAGVLIVFIRVMVQMVISGSNSMFTGELQSFLLGVALILPAALLYRHKKTRKEALLGMIAGTLVSTFTAVLTNLYLIIPFYVALYNMNMDQIILSCSKVNPMMNSVTTMVILGIVPFNLIKYGINCLITFSVYKKISPMIHRFANGQ